MASMIFDEQTTLGATVLTALDKRDVVYCRDISEEPPAGWVERPTKWRSFLSAPVIYEEQLLGMLTVDSPVADDFDLDRDAGMVFTLAHLLATALKA
ncbi:GAF domain-containing protein [Geodermatophilus nigrescens]|uniref:GAF domain-containing protein n=2 Tax=Geodermatophilus nigrescens TaxID=1070870 RepID=A0A1M5MA19_9ACTN|nr:GAF domain-containing protein [Geodermatophilus nigrescens]